MDREEEGGEEEEGIYILILPLSLKAVGAHIIVTKSINYHVESGSICIHIYNLETEGGGKDQGYHVG